MNRVLNKESTDVQVELTAKLFRGLGDSNRLQILKLLIEKERNVGELVDFLGAPQGRVSNHLACLRWCGYVTSVRKGRFLYYQIADERVKEVINLAESMMADNAEHIYSCTRIN